MTVRHLEVNDKFEKDRPCTEVLYSDVPESCRIDENRLYRITGSGEFESFVREVLVDPVSQDWEFLTDRDDSMIQNFDCKIDVTLETNVLDLEEEYLLDFCEDNPDFTPFTTDSITIFTRYYLTGPRINEQTVETVLRDLTNPVIHEWSVQYRDNSR